jgi:hypothetical protein
LSEAERHGDEKLYRCGIADKVWQADVPDIGWEEIRQGARKLGKGRGAAPVNDYVTKFGKSESGHARQLHPNSVPLVI